MASMRVANVARQAGAAERKAARRTVEAGSGQCAASLVQERGRRVPVLAAGAALVLFIWKENFGGKASVAAAPTAEPTAEPTSKPTAAPTG